MANGDYSPGAVGYKRPPKEHQFKKGQSGNPSGRPKSKGRTLNAEFAEMVLGVGDRVIDVSENGRPVKKRVIEGVMTKVAAQALKGDHRSAVFFQMAYEQALGATKAVKSGNVEAALSLKKTMREQIELREVHGATTDDVLPHPDDIHIDPWTSQVEYIGPRTLRQKTAWDDADELRQELKAEIKTLEGPKTAPPDIMEKVARKLALRQAELAYIDALMPEAAVRRSPQFDPFTYRERMQAARSAYGRSLR
jgi:hypothetical protein